MAKSRLQSFALIFVICFSIAILAITILMSMKNTDDLTAILEESIESQLLSASYAARSLIDADRFHSYNGPEDIESDPGYPAVLDSLRLLAENVGATYIYALKEIGGSYYFIFDTDPEVGSVAEIFDEYPDISDVHLSAFMGEDSAGVMNLSDMWGSFNTGAVPIFKDGEVIGIVTAKLIRGDVEGIGFAIPINDAIEIATGLIEHGYIAGRPLMGITTQTVTPGHAEYYEWVVGSYVRGVNPDSAAE
ncbi:MAG: S1C family serine protease, partial [Oscillospiraceae bacterium]|nr:S1C family serine protease [Oscillospiraceae bacterium]